MNNKIELNWPLILETAGAVFALVFHAVDLHIWHPVEGFLLIHALLIADFAAAVLYSYLNGRFETRLAKRVFYSMVGYSAVLFFAHNLGKYEAALAWLPHVVFLPLALLLLLSFIKNLALLGWIPEPLADWLHKKIDVYKNDGKNEIK